MVHVVNFMHSSRNLGKKYFLHPNSNKSKNSIFRMLLSRAYNNNNINNNKSLFLKPLQTANAFRCKDM